MYIENTYRPRWLLSLAQRALWSETPPSPPAALWTSEYWRLSPTCAFGPSDSNITPKCGLLKYKSFVLFPYSESSFFPLLLPSCLGASGPAQPAASHLSVTAPARLLLQEVGTRLRQDLPDLPLRLDPLVSEGNQHGLRHLPPTVSQAHLTFTVGCCYYYCCYCSEHLSENHKLMRTVIPK